VLEALRRAGREETTPYWQMLRDEIERMLELSDWFLLHDHLEEDNTAFYLHQFVERVQAAAEFHFDLPGRLTHETDRLFQHCDEVGERG
jgi:hypothetical protein